VSLWRVDRVLRAKDGGEVGADPGKPVQSYDRARGEFDAVFLTLPPGQSVRLMKADYDLATQALAWSVLKEGWVGR
jgi:hypothetical protein